MFLKQVGNWIFESQKTDCPILVFIKAPPYNSTGLVSNSCGESKLTRLISSLLKSALTDCQEADVTLELLIID